MKFLILLSLFSSLAFAEDLKSIFKSFDDINARPANVCTPGNETGPSLCADPMSACEDENANGYAEMVNDLRNSVAKSPEGDKFDRRYADCLASKKKFEEVDKEMEAINDIFKKMAKVKASPEKTKIIQAALARREINDKDQERVYKLRKESGKKLMELHAKLEDKILQKYSSSPEKIENILVNIKAAIVKQVKNEMVSPDGKLPNDDFQNIISSVVNSITISTANKIFTDPESSEDQYLSACGFDGLTPNAFFDSGMNQLIICPGLLISLLSKTDGDLGALALTIGHEIGHSIDSSSAIYYSVKAKNSEEEDSVFLNMAPEYDKISACLHDNYIKDKSEKFGTYAETIKQYENIGLPKLKAALEALQKAVPVDLILVTEFKRSIEITRYDLNKYKELAADDAQNNVPADFPSSLKREMIADYEAGSVINMQLEATSSNKRAQMMKGLLGPFCLSKNADKNREILMGDVNEASHAPKKFRIENFFRNPGTRELLGCAPLTASDRPWCSLEGAKKVK